MTIRTPLTTEEKVALAALGTCTFPVASWDKRFVRSLSGAAGLTDKERPQLWRLFIKYRRQIDCPRKAELLALAETMAAPDFRKQQAKEREMERYREAMNQGKESSDGR